MPHDAPTSRANRKRQGLLPYTVLWLALPTLACKTEVAGPARTTVNRQQTPYQRSRATVYQGGALRVKHHGEVHIQPFGRVPAWQIEALRSALETHYQFVVEVLPSRPLPTKAFYPPRNRYRAARLLDDLERRAPEGRYKISKILGVTTEDISITKATHRDWGVFGLGKIGGRSAVVSSRRLRPRGSERSSPQLRAKWAHRLRVMAIHEIGHTLGLRHCQEHGDHCPMRAAAGGAVVVDDSVEVLGPSCLTRLVSGSSI